jgi:hypothetical protein
MMMASAGKLSTFPAPVRDVNECARLGGVFDEGFSGKAACKLACTYAFGKAAARPGAA